MPADVKDTKKQTVGAVLKDARLKIKKDLTEISDELCIRKVYLAALEDGEYDKLPGDAYIYGFIRSYAGYLKMNADKLVKLYMDEVSVTEVNEHEKVEKVAKKSSDETVPLFNSKKFQARRYFMLFLLAVIAGLVIYILFLQPSPESSDVVETAPVEEVVTVDSTVVEGDVKVDAVEVPAEIPALPVVDTKEAVKDLKKVESEKVKEVVTKEVVKAEPSEEVDATVSHTAAVYGQKNGNVTLRADEGSEVWVQIIDRDDDNKIVMSRVLKDGDEYRLNDNENWYLTVGNAGGLTVLVDGEKVRKFGPNGVRRSNIQLDADELKAGTAYKG